MGAMSAITGSPNKVAEFLFDQTSMSHRFRVVIDSSKYDLGSWTKASGLSVSWAPHPYRWGENTYTHILPGAKKYSNIKLSRGACSDSATVQEWLAQVTKSFEPLCGVVMMTDFLGMPVLSWELREFFPIGWSIAEFDSGAARPAVEVLELAHSGFLHDDVDLKQGSRDAGPAPASKSLFSGPGKAKNAAMAAGIATAITGLGVAGVVAGAAASGEDVSS